MIKKIALSLAICSCLTTAAFADEGVLKSVNGHEVNDCYVTLKKDDTGKIEKVGMYPLRELVNYLDYKIDWDGAEAIVHANEKDFIIKPGDVNVCDSQGNVLGKLDLPADLGSNLKDHIFVDMSFFTKFLNAKLKDN